MSGPLERDTNLILLSAIGQRGAAALLRDLGDEDGSVRWQAIDALSSMGDEALVLLLAALVAHSDSVRLRESARQVFRLMAHGPLLEILLPVMAALNEVEPAQVCVVANVALGAIGQAMSSGKID